MSKKLNKALLPNLKEKINQVKIIPIEIDGEEFEVGVNLFLSLALRDKLILNIQTHATEENIAKYGEETLAFFAIFSTITDIEFSEDFEEAMELFISLINVGAIANIVAEIPDKLFYDINDALLTTHEILQRMVEENEVS